MSRVSLDLVPSSSAGVVRYSCSESTRAALGAVERTTGGRTGRRSAAKLSRVATSMGGGNATLDGRVAQKTLIPLLQ